MLISNTNSSSILIHQSDKYVKIIEMISLYTYKKIYIDNFNDLYDL